MLLKINKSDRAGTMEVIKENPRSHHGVLRAPLAYIIMKNIVIETCGNYFKYATSDDDLIARMLHLPPERNKLLSKHDI